MVVICEQCQTRFNLDESRVKGSKAKVRCSRCQHTFWVAVEPAEPSLDLELGEETRAPEPRKPWLESQVAQEEDASRIPMPPEFAPRPQMAEMPEEPRPRPEPIRIPPLLMPQKSSRTWITSLAFGLLGGVLIAGLAGWFWGIPTLRNKSKPPAAAPAPVTAEPKVEPKADVLTPPLPPPATEADLRGLEILGQEERYRGLTNRKGGPLLVILGKIKNTTEQPRGPIQLKAVLTDPQQKLVSERVFYAGTIIFDDELLNLDPAEINRWLDTAGGRSQKPVVAPGEMQSFMVVFFGVPQNLTGYGYKLQIIKGPVASGAR